MQLDLYPMHHEMFYSLYLYLEAHVHMYNIHIIS